MKDRIEKFLEAIADLGPSPSLEPAAATPRWQQVSAGRGATPARHLAASSASTASPAAAGSAPAGALAAAPAPRHEDGSLASYPPTDRWDDWTEYDPKAWPRKVPRNYMIIPTVCFNCESSCGLLGYVDKETLEIQKFEGNPVHPGSRGRNCAKGPATHNQVYDPERVLYPLKRVGERGGGQWKRVTWDEVLDDLGGRIRKAMLEERHNEIMYHVGRPGHDGLMEWILFAWGLDGHNSHTNVCSSGARAGYAFWTGLDRPSPDHENARVILLISSHLETGHYFNPHAQRIIEGKHKGARLIVFDTRLSNTASRADHWLAPWPGSEAAMLLAIARHLIATRQYDRDYVKTWVNWEDWLAADYPDLPCDFETFEAKLLEHYAEFTFDYAAAESGCDAEAIRAVAEEVARCGGKLATHVWRSASASNLGGWQVARTLWMLNVLTGSIGVDGGTSMNAWDKWIPHPHKLAPHPPRWNELTWPREYPLNFYEMSILLPHFVKEGRGKLDTYFTRVYNPVWTNPDGASWIEMLRDESQVGAHACLTPTWSETAWFSDYVLPMGLAPERHDIVSQETHAGCWIAFRQPVRRVALEKAGQKVDFTYEANPGEVWEETEFWIELSWRIDPDGELGVRQYFESPYEPGRKITVREYFQWMFENTVPGLPEKAAEEGLSPYAYMQKYGAFELRKGAEHVYDQPVSDDLVAAGMSTEDADSGIVYSKAPAGPKLDITPMPAFPGDERGRPVGIKIGDEVLRGFDTPSRKLELYSKTLHDWGWPEYALPAYIKSHVHPETLDLAAGERVLIPTFRLPTLIHTRSGNAKWLYEISHRNPLWIHTEDAAELGLKSNDLARVSTEIGHFVLPVWVTEGIRPGVVACSHHLGRWRLQEEGGSHWSSALVDLDDDEGKWKLRVREAAKPFESSDPDSKRVWWEDVGVHQNLTFPVHPDPVSGMHCWHQKVTVTRAEPGDRHGDVYVDTDKSHQVYKDWLAMTRPADQVSPDGLRRPHWLLRPFRPVKDAYRLPARGEAAGD